MDSALRARLTKQRSVARGMLTRIQSFLEADTALQEAAYQATATTLADHINIGSRDTTRMGAQHSFTYRHSFNYRIDDVFGIKMQGFGVAAAHPDTEDVHLYTTVITPNGK